MHENYLMNIYSLMNIFVGQFEEIEIWLSTWNWIWFDFEQVAIKLEKHDDLARLEGRLL